MATKKNVAKKPVYKSTNKQFTKEYEDGFLKPAGMITEAKAMVKQPSIAERFQQLDFDEAIQCFKEIKEVMKGRMMSKHKETEERFAQIKEFCAVNNI